MLIARVATSATIATSACDARATRIAVSGRIAIRGCCKTRRAWHHPAHDASEARSHRDTLQAYALRRHVPLKEPVGQCHPQCLPVDDGLKADALRGGLVAAGAEGAVPDWHERLLVCEPVGRGRKD